MQTIDLSVIDGMDFKCTKCSTGTLGKLRNVYMLNGQVPRDECPQCDTNGLRGAGELVGVPNLHPDARMDAEMMEPVIAFIKALESLKDAVNKRKGNFRLMLMD
jgi:hypothetical protein